MIVRVDADSAVPVFEQVRAQIGRMILSGQLAEGTQLPPIRHLAADLGLARGTIAKVYEELAREGLVVQAGRRGTVVRRQAAAGPDLGDLGEAAMALALVAHQLGVEPATAHAALTQALAELPSSALGAEKYRAHEPFPAPSADNGQNVLP